VNWLDALALVLGVLVVGAAAHFVSPLAAQGDPNMVWEARIATGFAAILPFGVLWTAQVVTTPFAMPSTGGIWPGWLWIWLLAASAIGCSPPAPALSRRLVRPPGTDLHPDDTAVAQAADVASADTVAESGWQLRRTPPLPNEWPPIPYGHAGVEAASDAQRLIDAIWNGDSRGPVDRELRQWQDHNAVIAARPFVARDLPGAAAS